MGTVAIVGETDPFLFDNVIGDLTSDGFNISEETTPTIPGDTSGATSEISVSGIGKSRALLATGAELIVDTLKGGRARGIISTSTLTPSSGVLQLSADSLINRLNVEVRANAYFGSSGSLYAAFVQYMALVGITAGEVTVAPEIYNDKPVFPGFVGNLWDHMKQMCSANNYQIYSTGNMIGLSRPGRVTLEILEPDTGVLTVDNLDRAQRVDVNNYNLTAVTNGVFFKADSVYSLNAGETQEIRVTVEGTPNTINNPVCVSGMNLGMVTGSGQYVVTGSDGYILAPAFWTDNGGKVEVRVSDTAADEIIINLTAPSETTRAPYRISEGEADRPALWITGTGVLTDLEVVGVPTGDTSAPEESVEIDNKFISSRDKAFSRGVLAAQMYGGPTVHLAFSGVPDLTLVQKSYTYTVPPSPTVITVPEVSITAWFGFLSGSILSYGGSRYRVLHAEYTPEGVSLTLDSYVTFYDFDAVWAGQTFTQFDAAMGTQLTFAQQALAPLAVSV